MKGIQKSNSIRLLNSRLNLMKDRLIQSQYHHNHSNQLLECAWRNFALDATNHQNATNPNRCFGLQENHLDRN